MFDAGFVSFLAGRSIRYWAKSAELRQTICARLSRNPRLGQDAAGAEITRGCRCENGRQICRSVRAVDQQETSVAALYERRITVRRAAATIKRSPAIFLPLALQLICRSYPD